MIFVLKIFQRRCKKKVTFSIQRKSYFSETMGTKKEKKNKRILHLVQLPFRSKGEMKSIFISRKKVSGNVWPVDTPFKKCQKKKKKKFFREKGRDMT